MSMNIYTTGSAEFLEIMLNAAAMITGAGISEDLARIGLLIGLLILGFQAVFNGQAISFQKAGLALVLYLMFFGPTTTAVIEETTTGQVRVVDNVPIGPTFVGSVISTVAYEITRVSEQAFSTPRMTDYGLFSSLNTIARVRDTLRNPMALEGFVNYKANEGWNFPKSMDEFLTYCVLNPISLREFKDVDQLFRAGSANDVLTAPLSSQYVYLFDGPAGGRMVSCSEAQAVLQLAFVQVYQGLFDDILNRGFAPEKAAGKMNTGGEAEARVNDAIQSFAISAKNAQGYVASAVVMPIFNDSRVNALNHWQEKNAAMALRESINHQEARWAARGDLFKHYMRPMIAFFEGLLYAMTPFMAFAIVLGSPGLSVLGKYMMLPLAVGMWMPLLSIVNAFTLWYANAEISAILNSYDPTGPGFAMLQVLDMDQAISKALGIGGLLAASVPPLALFIVSGSAMVMNGIMTQASQGSTFKSEDLMPRAKNQAPVMDTTSSFTSDSVTQGVSVTGAPKLSETISAQQAASALVQSTQTESLAATQAYQKNIASAVEQSATTSAGRSTLADLGRSVGSNLNLSKNSQYTDAASTLRQLGYSEDQIAAGTFAASVGASAPYSIAGVKLEESQQFKQMNNEQQQQARQAMQQLTSAVQASSSDQTIFQSGEAFTTASQASLSQKATESLSESLTEARMAQQAYQRASSMQDVYGAGQSFNLKEAADRSLEKGGTRQQSAEQLAAIAGATESGRELMRKALASDSIRELSGDENERLAMSAIRAINQDGRLGDLVNSNVSPFDFNVRSGDAERFAGLSDNSPKTEGLKGLVAAGVAGASAAYASLDDMNRSGQEALLDSGAIQVAAASDAANLRVNEFQDMERARIEAQMADTPLNQVDITMNTVQPVEDTASNFVQAPMSSFSNGTEQVLTGAARVAGVGENAVVKSAITAISSPLDTAATGVRQIVGAVSGIVDKSKGAPPLEDLTDNSPRTEGLQMNTGQPIKDTASNNAAVKSPNTAKPSPLDTATTGVRQIAGAESGIVDKGKGGPPPKIE